MNTVPCERRPVKATPLLVLILMHTVTCNKCDTSTGPHLGQGGSTQCFKGSERFRLKVFDCLTADSNCSRVFHLMVVLGEKRV